MVAFLSFLLSLVFSVESLTYECNFVNMGFGVIQPVGQCVIGKHAQYEAPMSMEQICIDPYTVETRLYQNMDCDGDTYEVVDQFDCQDEAEFVECECHHHVIKPNTLNFENTWLWMLKIFRNRCNCKIPVS